MVFGTLPVALRGALRAHLRVTDQRFGRLTPSMPWPGLLPSAARLTRTLSAASHEEPRSLRSFAQYSSRFLTSRSKPRSGGL